MKKLLLLSMSLLSLCLGHSFAGISVSPSILDFLPGQQTDDIKVTNSGKSISYVAVSITKIENPGSPEEKNMDVTPSMSPFDVGLAVSPSKMVLEPGAIQNIRLIPFLKNLKEDAVYIISIKPKFPEMVANNTSKGVEVGIGLALGYGVRVFIRPIAAQAKLVSTRKGKVVTIQNLGNSNVVLNNAKQCPAAKKCELLPDVHHRLYARNVWKFTVPYDAPIEFRETFIDKTTSYIVK